MAACAAARSSSPCSVSTHSPAWSKLASDHPHRTYVACATGDLPFLVTRKLPIKWDAHAAQGAAMGGHIVCLRFAITHGAPYDVPMLTLFAAQKGNLDVLQWLVVRMCGELQWHPQSLYWAALNGHTECVAFILERMPVTRDCVAEALSVAIHRNHAACVALLAAAAPP